MNTCVRHPERCGGFSLIELMIVIVLLGITAGLAAPKMGEYIAQHRTKRALDQVAGDIAYARLTAVQNGRRVVVRFSPDGTYSVDTIRQVDNEPVALKRVSLVQDYPGVAFRDAIEQIEFNSRGLALMNERKVVIRHPRARAIDSLFVAPTGRVYRAF